MSVISVTLIHNSMMKVIRIKPELSIEYIHRIGISRHTQVLDDLWSWSSVGDHVDVFENMLTGCDIEAILVERREIGTWDNVATSCVSKAFD